MSAQPVKLLYYSTVQITARSILAQLQNFYTFQDLDAQILRMSPLEIDLNSEY